MFISRWMEKDVVHIYNELFIQPSVQFSCSIVADSLQPHGLQHPRLPCPSPAPRACSNSCPLSRWCHPTISSSSAPFSCLHFFLHQGLFQWVSSRKQISTSSSEVDELRACHVDWSKSEKEILYINVYIWTLKTIVLMSLCAEKEWRHRSREWTCGHRGRGGEDDLRKHHWHGYTTECRTTCGKLPCNAGSSIWCSVMT